MANVKRHNRVQDADIIRLNHVGIGLKAIADLLGCHPATITLRLKALGIPPTDTRRSFMESVFESLTPDQQEWLSHNLFNAQIPVKDFVVRLIQEAYAAEPTVKAAPVPMPAMNSVDEEALKADPAYAQAELEAELDELADATPNVAEIPQVEPELVEDAPQMCGVCNEAPEMTGTGLCPGCADQKQPAQTQKIF